MRLTPVIVSLALASSASAANRQWGVKPHFHQGINNDKNFNPLFDALLISSFYRNPSGRFPDPSETAFFSAGRWSPLIRLAQYADAARTCTPTPATFGINPTVTLPSNYKLVWNQDFRTLQYAHINNRGILSTGTVSRPAIWSTTPVGSPASYTPPGTDHFPFSTDAGYLVISQFNKPDGTASGGIMHSSHKGTGFVAANAYWEASIRLPGGGKNQWPIFWMVSSPWTANSAEIDIAENGYQIPNSTNGVAPIHLHNWTNTDHGGSQGDFEISSLPDTLGGWHAFGCLIQPGSVTIYLDGAKITSFSVGPNFSNSMGVVLQMTNYTGTTTGTPGDLGVQYVRCWAP